MRIILEALVRNLIKGIVLKISLDFSQPFLGKKGILPVSYLIKIITIYVAVGRRGGGKLIVFDYDGTNQQTLMAASGAYLPDFSSDYDYVFSMVPSPTAGKLDLDRTALLTPADL